MSPARKALVGRLLPPFITVTVSVFGAALAAWIAMTNKVSALEVRVEERKDDISQIRQDVREVREQVADIHRALIGERRAAR